MSNLYHVHITTAQQECCVFALQAYLPNNDAARKACLRIRMQNSSYDKFSSRFTLNEDEMHAVINAMHMVITSNQIPDTRIYRETVKAFQQSLNQNLIQGIDSDNQLYILDEKTDKIIFLSPCERMIVYALTKKFRNKLGCMRVGKLQNNPHAQELHTINDIEWLCMVNNMQPLKQ